MILPKELIDIKKSKKKLPKNTILYKGQKSINQTKKITKGSKESQNTMLLKGLKDTNSKKIRKIMMLKKVESSMKNLEMRRIQPKEKNLEEFLISPWKMPGMSCMTFSAKE